MSIHRTGQGKGESAGGIPVDGAGHRQGRSLRRAVIASVLPLLLWCARPGVVGAYVLDWASVPADWTAGATSQSFSDVDGSGVDITINLASKPGYDDGNFNGQYRSGWPDDSNVGTLNGEAENPDVLWQAVDRFSNASQYVSVLVTFSAPVSNVVFGIDDIDSIRTGQERYRDEISNIFAEGPDGTVYGDAEYANGASTLTYVITGDGTANLRITALAPSGASNRSAGADTGGDATVNFGPNTITNFYYRYGNANYGSGDPTLQWTGLGDILFDVVPDGFEIIPEPSMLVGAAVFFTVAIAGSIWSRFRHRPRRV